MEYIQELFYLAHDYWILTLLVGFLSCFIESFLPMLPLVAIVSANAFIFGLWGGLFLSWIGSGLGTISLFLLASKFSDCKLVDKLRNGKMNGIIKWLHKQGFKLLFIAYSCPFIPGFLVTLGCALCKRDLKSFAPAMLSGKFVMFLAVSYPTSDIKGFLSSPIKIAIFVGLVLLSWKIGNRVNTRLEDHNDNDKIEGITEIKDN
ncbi:TVP38/TMEM64 family protein [Romboutsia sp.]|uniref:TVP38/TMEM64 family protein n=1 Tax=Romboutsia sp. TaxID=1965302 RepID=UPI003F30BBF0